MPEPLSPDLLQKMHAYWRAANYLSVGQIYLQDNPLLESPLRYDVSFPLKFGKYCVGFARSEMLRCRETEAIGGSSSRDRTQDSLQNEPLSKLARAPFIDLRQHTN